MGDVYIEIDGKRIKIGSDKQQNDTVEDPPSNDDLFNDSIIYEQEEPQILTIHHNKEDILKACASDLTYIKISDSYMTCGVYFNIFSQGVENRVMIFRIIGIIEHEIKYGKANPSDLFIIKLHGFDSKININISFEDKNGKLHCIYNENEDGLLLKDIKMYYMDGVLMLPDEY